MSRQNEGEMQPMQRSNSFSSSHAPYQPMNNQQDYPPQQRSTPSPQQPLPHRYGPASPPPPVYTTYSSDSATQPATTTSSSKTVTLNLRTLAGQVMTVAFPGASLAGITVLNVKEKLESTHNIPVSFQRLIFAGRELNDAEYCTNYGMEDGAMIHLFLRQSYPDGQAPPPDTNIPVGIPVAPPAVNDADEQGVMLTHELELLRLAQASRAIKIWSLVDIIWLFVWAIKISPFFIAVSVLAVCASYAGAHYYRKDLTVGFCLYLLLSMGTRIYIMIAVTDTPTYVLMALGMLIDLYVLRLVLMFLRLIAPLTAAQRQELIAFSRPQFGWGIPR